MFDWHDALAAAIRAASFIAILQMGGIALFLALYRRDLDRSLRSSTSFGIYSGCAGILLAFVSQSFVAARMSGELSGVFASNLQSLSWLSSSGLATAVRILGVLATIVALKRRSGVVAWAGVGGIILSVALTGHTSTHSPRFLLAALLVLHLGIVVFWLGALPGLFIALKYESTWRVVSRFSTAATRWVPVLGVVGIVLACLLLPSFSALSSAYGSMLMMKVAGFFLTLSVAAVNKLRLVPALERGDGRAVAQLRHSIAVEYILIVAVLCATATMTTLFSPE
jgi:putative copper resistance protein D